MKNTLVAHAKETLEKKQVAVFNDYPHFVVDTEIDTTYVINIAGSFLFLEVVGERGSAKVQLSGSDIVTLRDFEEFQSFEINSPQSTKPSTDSKVELFERLTMMDFERLGIPTKGEREHSLLLMSHSANQTLVFVLGNSYITVSSILGANTLDVKFHGEHERNLKGKTLTYAVK